MVAGDADGALGLGVVRLHLVVVDGPVGDVGTVDRSELAGETEVDLAVARQLAVGVVSRAADRRRHVVDVAGEGAVAVGGRAAVRARLEQRIGAEEVPAVELDLVVREVAEVVERRLERQQVIAPFSRMHTDFPAAVSTSAAVAPPGPEPTIDDVEVRHSTPLRRCSRAAARRREVRSRANR